MDQILLFYSKACVNQFQPFRHCFSNYKKISLTTESDYWLTERGVGFSSVSDYNIQPSEYKDLYQRWVELLKAWGDITIDGKTLNEATTIKGISIWGLLETELGELNLEKIMVYADIINTIIKEENPKELVYFNHNWVYLIPREKAPFNELIKAIAEKHHIKSCTIPSGFNISPILHKITHTISLFRDHQRKNMQAIKTDLKNPVMFILYGGGMDKTVPIQQQFPDSISICDGGITSNRCKDVLDKYDLNYRYTMTFFDEDVRNATDDAYKEVKKYWGDMIKEKPHFMYNGLDLFNVIKPQLQFIYKYQLYKIVRLIFIFDKMLTQYDPDMVVTVNDSFFFNKCAIMMAKMKGLKTMLIQHASAPDISCQLYPVSEYAAVWYPDKRYSHFLPVGNTKLPYIQQKFHDIDKDKVRAELGIKTEKVVVFAVRCPYSRDLFRIRDIVESVDDGTTLIIKYHPAETHITKLIKKKNVLYLKNYDFIKLLKIADLVVTTEGCTTCSDALSLNIPTVVIGYETGFDQEFCEPKSYTQCFARVDDRIDLKTIISKHLNIS